MKKHLSLIRKVFFFVGVYFLNTIRIWIEENGGEPTLASLFIPATIALANKGMPYPIGAVMERLYFLVLGDMTAGISS